MLQKLLDLVVNNTMVTAVGGAAAGFLINHVSGIILGQFWPERQILSAIKRVNDHIEGFKKKYPDAGKQLEDRVLNTLNEAITIIKS